MADTFTWLGNLPIRTIKSADGLFDLAIWLKSTDLDYLAQQTSNTPATAKAPTTDEAILLASAQRSGTITTSDQTNYLGVRGAGFILDVTAAGGALKTLRMDLETLDPASGKYLALASTGVIGTTVTPTGTYIMVVYPGASNLLTSLLTAVFAQALVLPRTFRVKIIPNDATNWQYSLGMILLR